MEIRLTLVNEGDTTGVMIIAYLSGGSEYHQAAE